MFCIQKNSFGRLTVVAAIMATSFWLATCQSNEEWPADWMKIPIKSCIASNQSIIGETKEIGIYCECLIPKVYEQYKNDRAKVSLLRKGDLEFLKLSNDPQLLRISKDCQPAAPDVRNKAKLSDVMLPHMERGIKIGLRDELTQKGMAEQLDIDAYCDCMVEGIKATFTMNEFGRRDVQQTKKYKDLDQQCWAKHKR
ncbi:MAG: hypothetical protein AAF985_24520 [Bacteroidota bacterium]